MGDGTCWASDYCIHQPKTLYVKEGESVTIPCSYTYPEYWKGRSRVTVTWGERDGIFCNNIKKNITDHSGNITDEYKDRISAVHHPDNRTASITIRGLKAADGTTFCCRVIRFTAGSAPFTWYDVYGTSLVFPDGRSVTQVEELIAVPGEEMIIPCHYTLEILGEALQVTWYRVNSDLCILNDKRYTWTSAHTYNGFSLVNFPEDVSLRIHSVQKVNESLRYCCWVDISNRQIMQSRYGTELTVPGPPSSSSPFSVTQPYTITGRRGESVILTCSYSGYKESDVLGVNIYWRLGNTTGPYVYHPYREMVHPSYRGRTEVTGAADLHIRGLQKSNDSTYYCFVMLRLCAGRFRYEKRIQYGKGTRLIVTDPPHLPQPVIISISSAAVLLVLLCVILVIWRKTGVICKKKDVLDETSDNPDYVEFAVEEGPYSEISTKNTEHNHAAESKEEVKQNEDIHYSELNKTKLMQRIPTSNQNEEIQPVYAAVAHPDSRK
ncbi:uncharacterized protein [Eleutherodactylus coqui]|uniref:uncharacterized protein n=1 Tax=Eleutherodactylus coqui TaxID=57060 RepID=UPI003462F909